MDMEQEMMQEEDNLLTLTDENGEETEFEYLDSVEYEGSQYAVVLPVDSEDGTVLIMEMIPDDDSDDEEAWLFNGIEDQSVLDAVYEEFKKNNGDEFDFE